MRIAAYALNLITLLTGVFLFVPALGMAPGESCRALLVGQIRPDFHHNTNYTKVIDKKGSIKDQCNLGTCPLMAATSYLERSFEKRNSHSIELSTEYLAAKRWMEAALEAFQKLDDSIVPELGLHLDITFSKILQYGLVPASAWQGGTKFQSREVTDRMNGYIKNIIANAKWESQKQEDPKVKFEIINEARHNIHEVFESVLGTLPKEFQYEGQTFTPQTFAKRYFPELMTPLIRIQMLPKPENRTEVYRDLDDRITSVSANAKDLELAIRSLIDSNIGVKLAYHHDANFYDPKTGILSNEAFHVPKWAKPLSAEQRKRFGEKTAAHAVEIVGYELDPKTNRVVKWLIKNSWGIMSADKGFMHMYRDYFLTNFLYIIVPQNAPISFFQGEYNR